MRCLLGHYFFPDEPRNINTLHGQPVLSIRNRFDNMMGVSSADMSASAVENLRPDFCRETARSLGQNEFVKIHDAYGTTPNGAPIFPADAVCGVIYLIRNPLNVVLSYANHNHSSIQSARSKMLEKTSDLFNNDRFSFPQLRQFVGSWDHHVCSWVDQTELSVTVIRYEDLTKEPMQSLARAVAAFGVEPQETLLQKAITACQFTRLQDQENTHGFVEKKPNANRFFDKGNARDWRVSLPPDQAKTLTDAFGVVMSRFGYDTAEFV